VWRITTYKVFVGRLRRKFCTWEDNTEIVLKEIGWVWSGFIRFRIETCDVSL
jgi:hypothetical protein